MSAVERGAALLDEKYGPHWDKKIDLETLDLGDACGCILGQLEAGHSSRRGSAYSRGLRKLGFKCYGEADAAYGFDTVLRPGSRGFGSYERLTRAWKRLIRQRQEARSPVA